MRKSFSLMLLLVAFSVMAFAVTEVSSQELTGDSSPIIKVIPADDSLLVLEAQVEDAEWQLEVAKSELSQLSKVSPSTTEERVKHFELLREARKGRAQAMATVHLAKAAWCTYYASLGDDSGQYLRSAYAHRRTAQAMQAQVWAFTASALPTVEYSGKHQLSIE